MKALMAFLLRRKFVCFYCGSRSAQTRTPNVCRWKCEHCEAENFLDEVRLFTFYTPPTLFLLTCYTTEWRSYRPSSRKHLLQRSLCTSTCSANSFRVRDTGRFLVLPDLPQESASRITSSSFLLATSGCARLCGIYKSGE